AMLVFEEIGLPPNVESPRTPKGEYSTTEPALKKLLQELPAGHKAAEVLEKYLQYKTTKKTVNTYTGSEEAGLLAHTRPQADGTLRVFPQYGTFLVTDRLSSNSPNIQNQPRKGLVRSF